MRSSPPWSTLLLGSILTLALTACPQTQSPEGQGGPSAEAGGQGGPPEMGSAKHPDDARWKVIEGEAVAIEGTVSYRTEATGSVRIDVLTQAGEAPPHLVSAETLDGLGAFSIQAPKDFGEVHLVAFIDTTGDGPSPDDAAATTKITIGTEDIAGLELTLEDEPDLGGLTPGSPPGEDGKPTGPAGEAPPPGEGSPDGKGPPPEGEGEDGKGPPPDGKGPPPGGEGPPPQAPPAEPSKTAPPDLPTQ